MSMDNNGRPTGLRLNTSTNSLQMEERRAILRKALLRNPENQEIKQAMIRTLGLSHVKKAAQRGVFMSYNRNDELFALDLDQDLRAVGIRVWLDVIDISPSMDWQSAVTTALRDCGVMLVILSPDSVADETAQAERAHFINSGKIIIPLLYQSCDLRSIEDIFVPPVDFRQSYQRGLQQLLRILSSPDEASV